MTLLVPRTEWRAQYGRGYPTEGAKALMIVHHDGHTRSRADMTVEQERKLMRFYEDYHVNGEPAVLKNGKVVTAAIPGLTRANPRIAYSFVVMQSGRLYEGCGWGRVGAHTANMNSSAYGAFFPLNGAKTAPTEAALAAFQWLRDEGVRLGQLTADHAVKGHQDFNKPSCPGKLVYAAAVLGAVAPVPVPTPSVSPVVIQSDPPRLVWSNAANDWLVVTKYENDAHWYFVPLKSLAAIGSRAQTALSAMPLKQP